ncbi:rhamnulokinase [Sediminispirochaeta smaragdinae]|jgi:sugar (pentulose or hexulose) kinase|uniref:Carbohydrate kinase, FGGY n=1 Tax=Sediminispirochaeta smaragdinae (strain DSM 11293 / JCM 15392 / SEBR 4228) TaxID=573413 RepID=E1RA85_SEDSS|nr:FGGY family carbohydrate kinase [Sediminispirochaeta smaragdinae]ADK79376.1 Carbohydrate kinase, FGGY [Sediminispirochaeta smaragdinae DSM 11293]
MSGKEIHCVGFDCGNSSIRTVLGHFDGTNIEVELIQQVPNGTVRVEGYDYWDILHIFSQMQQGLKQAVAAAGGTVASAGISTWGIDFGLFGPSGQLLGNPLCYRNELGGLGLGTLGEESRKKMFEQSGIQNHPMNSVYQFVGIRDHLPEYYRLAEKMMLTPDLLNFLFTGSFNTETSIASTTQLMNMRSGRFDDSLFDIAGIKKGIMPPVVDHGTVRGMLRQDIADYLDIAPLPFVAVPSHDTAAAVVTVPSLEGPFAFISSGTWSLIGTELSAPLINDEVYNCELANEGGACGTITLLKNSAGMHILQNVKNELEMRENRRFAWDEVVDLSLKAAAFLGDEKIPLFDPNHPSLYNPDSMIQALQLLTGEKKLDNILAGIYASLACNYGAAICDIEKITGTEYPVIHIIGGGCRNDHLNQMTADISGKPVVAGPVEATSLGTIAVQLMHHVPGLGLTDIRKIVSDSVQPLRFEPKVGRDRLYQRYEELLKP